jgi:hypothetical protein
MMGICFSSLSRGGLTQPSSRPAVRLATNWPPMAESMPQSRCGCQGELWGGLGPEVSGRWRAGLRNAMGGRADAVSDRMRAIAGHCS